MSSLLEELCLYESKGEDVEKIKSLQKRYRCRIRKCKRRKCYVKIERMNLKPTKPQSTAECSMQLFNEQLSSNSSMRILSEFYKNFYYHFFKIYICKELIVKDKML